MQRVFLYLGIKVQFEKVDHIRIVETKAICFVLYTATTNYFRNPKYILIEENTVVYIAITNCQWYSEKYSMHSNIYKCIKVHIPEQQYTQQYFLLLECISDYESN